MAYIRIEDALAGFHKEKDLLLQYNPADMAEIIRDVGFSCNLCGRCCTASFNGHVFLLDADATRAKIICHDAMIPAPEFELCDETGSFYVSGYSLRVNPDGTCIHLKEGRCQIYSERFTICRIYPYMLHREYDSEGKYNFRQIGGLNEHGEYYHDISGQEALKIAHDTISYELCWLNQMISFYTRVMQIFRKNEIRYIRRVYDTSLRAFKKGETARVFVWYQGDFILHYMRSEEYEGMGWP
jgi:hypothetical protein